MKPDYFITRENLERLAECVINDAQPVVNQSCDWVGYIPAPRIYPLAVYRRIQEMRNADSSSTE